jgi:hypothetical protein
VSKAEGAFNNDRAALVLHGASSHAEESITPE